MLRSLDEYRRDRGEIDKERKAAQTAARADQLSDYHRASVGTHLLTGEKHWDVFLQYIAGAIEGTERQRDGLLESLSDPAIVDDLQVRRMRAAVLACNERIGAWKAVLDLPKDLIQRGDKAKTLLEKMAEPAA